MRKRATQAATTQMGRMGAEDPVGISGRIPVDHGVRCWAAYPLSVYRTLEYLRGISDDDVRRLRSRGIQHTNQLLHRTSLGIDRDRLSKKTGITPERLLEFAHQCTLLEVSGMERQLPVIRRLGIESMRALRAQDAVELHAKLADAVGLAGAPSLSDVQYWISQATALDIIEEPEEKAPLPAIS